MSLSSLRALAQPLASCRGAAYRGLRRLSSQSTAQSSTEQHEGFQQQQQPQRRIKHKIPEKRASMLLGFVQKEAIAARPLDFPDFKTGDAIECQMLPYMTAPKAEPVRGIVLGRFKRGIASSFIVRDVLYDEAIERRVPLYSPLLKSITVLKRRAIYEGKQEGKRVRPSKIYYLRNLDNKYSQVTGRQFSNPHHTTPRKPKQ
ncbi:translation protein SH3-like domain-containing protein [Tribonema minus]|uniref:50S ribosomal protein L19, chloroplastic n=1 Tax=Tribonema minus TaxID=303371 RepID=A0A835ZJ13_9STRA|nr:translation protein SH3-like domain-containing protein [Tribonema minus]